jgi:hypothetical protein
MGPNRPKRSACAFLGGLAGHMGGAAHAATPTRSDSVGRFEKRTSGHGR